MEQAKEDVVHLEQADEKLENEPSSNTRSRALGQAGQWEANVSDAHMANIEEHEQSLWQALRAYPGAVFWSLTVSMSIIMEG